MVNFFYVLWLCWLETHIHIWQFLLPCIEHSAFWNVIQASNIDLPHLLFITLLMRLYAWYRILVFRVLSLCSDWCGIIQSECFQKISILKRLQGNKLFLCSLPFYRIFQIPPIIFLEIYEFDIQCSCVLFTMVNT